MIVLSVVVLVASAGLYCDNLTVLLVLVIFALYKDSITEYGREERLDHGNLTTCWLLNLELPASQPVSHTLGMLGSFLAHVFEQLNVHVWDAIGRASHVISTRVLHVPRVIVDVVVLVQDLHVWHVCEVGLCLPEQRLLHEVTLLRGWRLLGIPIVRGSRCFRSLSCFHHLFN